MNEERLRGVVVPALTPFGPDGTVDEVRYREHLRFMIDGGVHGLFPLGTAGEGLLLSVAERQRMAEVCVDAAAGRVPVLMHTGAITTQDAITLTAHAQQAGAAGAAVVAPFFFAQDERGIEAHFRAVLEAVPDFPIYLYNIPSASRNPIPTALVSRLAKAYPHLHGLKDSSATLTQVIQYVDATPPEFVVLTGSNELTLPTLVVGGHGVVASLANVFPEPVVEVCEAYWSGDLARAQEQQLEVNRLRGGIDGSIAALKAAVRLTGRPFGSSRPPVLDLAEEDREAIRLRLEKLGVI
jgi:4-hydroxy-tetrahydrodipicolinate synthase